jgi:hypothetical protein
MAAVVNGVLVFAVPAGFMVLALVSASGRTWPDEMAAHRPTNGQVALESAQFGLIFAVLAALAAWRTWVHALRYQSGTSHVWQGVGEAAAVGFVGAVLYLARGIVTQPSDAPPYVIVYGSAAAILGALVGFVLRLSATIVLKLSKSVAA